MDSTSLQTPKAGRSRFSKALPAPPPGLDDRPDTIPRKLPSLPPTPFPPRKDIVSVRTGLGPSPSVKSKPLDTPLPSLPPKMESPQSQTHMNSIRRRPVGQPATSPEAQSAESAPKSKTMKRMSSISSLLSAYSYTSADSVQRSSQGSIVTKDSEPSYSPGREGMNIQQEASKNFGAFSGNPYAYEGAQMNDGTLTDVALPPPLPLKDTARPSTPQSSRPVDSHRDGVPTSSPVPVVGGSPQRREIWRRRASSKSDRSLALAELKLPVSHGSTVATSSAANAPETLPVPQPSPQNNHSTTTPSPLPPRTGSLPGRNIRPARKAVLAGNDEMGKLSKLSKLKDQLVKRVGNSKDDDEPKEQLRESETTTGTAIEAEHKPELPAKDLSTPTSWATDVRKPVGETVGSPIVPVSSPERPLRESGAGNSISRRAVGSPGGQQQEVQKKTSSASLRKPVASPSSRDGRQHAIAGSPRGGPQPSRSNQALRSPPASQTVQETVRDEAAKQNLPIPPAAHHSGLPRSPRPDQMTAPTARPAATPAKSDEPLKKPGLFDLVSSLNDTQQDTTSDADGQHKKTPAPVREVSNNTSSVALSDVHEATDDGDSDNKKDEQLTEEQTEALNNALARFPRTFELTCSADGVWPATPLADKHYNCYTKHRQWVPAKNVNYPLACQTCGVQDKNPRRVCAWCNLRICYKCHGLLMANGRDLKAAMPTMLEEKRREKGKDKQVASPTAADVDATT